MTLILLAISLTITFCVIAWHLAIYALPVMTGITAFQYVYATGSGFWLSALAAIGAAIGSIVLVIGVLGFARNPALRLIALAIFAIPAVIAGYALVHGVTKHMIDSAIAINILGGIGGIVIGIAAVLNLNAVGRLRFHADIAVPVTLATLAGAAWAGRDGRHSSEFASCALRSFSQAVRVLKIR